MSAIRTLVLVALLALGTLPAAGQMALPSDVYASCPVPSTELAGWFAGGSPSAGGWVQPADSVSLPTDNTVCDFYKWGAQMFLWLTSPQGDGLVLDSSAIFNVLPADSRGIRYLQDADNETASFALRAEKFDEIGEVGQAAGRGETVATPPNGAETRPVRSEARTLFPHFLGTRTSTRSTPRPSSAATNSARSTPLWSLNQ